MALPVLIRAALSLVLISSTTRISAEHFPCQPQKFQEDSVVCVCNATYCDNVPDLPALQGDMAVLVTSSQAGDRLKVTSAQWQAESRTTNLLHPEAVVSIVINRTETKQTILGFGGAFTDAAGINIAKLPDAAQTKLINSYYAQDGIGYTIARVPIGGCDFSTRPYTYDDVPGDVTLSNFSLAEEDSQYKIPYLLRALQTCPSHVRVFASPWSAPAWMKTNNNLTGAGRLREEYYQLWAEYYLRFLDAYTEAGIPIWGLTTQNEPIDGLEPGFTFNCMGWTAETQGKWVRDNLGPTLEKSDHNGTKIMIMDDQRIFLPAWPDTVLADPETAKYVDGIAVHWYIDHFTPSSLLTKTHENHPDKFILNTEACEGSMPWQIHKVALGSWTRAQTYATDIIRDLNNWVTGWVDWNIALDTHGGPNWVSNFVDSPVIVDAEQARFYKQPMFYSLAHFARYLPPGSTVLGVTPGERDGVLATAAVTPTGQTVAVLLNTARQVRDVTLTDTGRGHLDLQLQPRSLVSVIWQAA